MAAPSTKSLIVTSAALAFAGVTLVLLCAALTVGPTGVALVSGAGPTLGTLSLIFYAWAMFRDARKEKVSSAVK
jgi:hypothetical protein